MLPYVDKTLVSYFRNRYNTSFMLEHAERKHWNAEKSVGFMMGIVAIIDDLEALSRKDDDD